MAFWHKNCDKLIGPHSPFLDANPLQNLLKSGGVFDACGSQYFIIYFIVFFPLFFHHPACFPIFFEMFLYFFFSHDPLKQSDVSYIFWMFPVFFPTICSLKIQPVSLLIVSCIWSTSCFRSPGLEGSNPFLFDG